MKALVTGCAGFIGTHLCRRLEKDGWEVEGLDIAPSKYGIGDASTQRVFGFDPDVVFHLACLRMSDCEFNPGMAYSSNLGTVVNLVDEHPLAQHVLASTSSIYQDGLRLTERSDVHAKTIYGLSKFAAEKFVKHYAPHYTILRFGNVYGPGHDPNHPSPDVISTFIDRARRGLPMIVNDPKAVRDFVHVDDIVEGLIKATGKTPPGVYNLGTGRPVSIGTLAKCITAWRAAYNLPFVSTEEGSARAIDTVKIKTLDSSKAKKCLGWEPKIDFADGLTALLRS